MPTCVDLTAIRSTRWLKAGRLLPLLNALLIERYPINLLPLSFKINFNRPCLYLGEASQSQLLFSPHLSRSELSAELGFD